MESPLGAGHRDRALGRESGYWIDDEGLLRDEGTLFGMAAYRYNTTEALLDTKLKAIRQHFEPRLQQLQARHSEKEQALVQAAKEYELRLQEAAQKRSSAAEHHARAGRLLLEADTLDPQEPGAAHQTWRLGLGIAAAVATSVTSYWIVYDHLDRSGLDFPVPVSLAITLAGHFHLFQPVSVLFTSDASTQERAGDPELWKRHLGEWVLPIGAALFVALYAYPSVGVVRSLAAFLLLIGLFVVIGRMLLGKVTHLRLGRQRLQKNRADAQKAQDDAVRLGREAEEAEAIALRLHLSLDVLRGERDNHAAELAHGKQHADYKVQLFRSEYEFARHAMKQREEAGLNLPKDLEDMLPEMVVPTDSE